MADDLVTSGYDAVYEALPRSPTFRRIWSELACGPDYPSDFSHISFLTRRELVAVSERLALPRSGTLLDLACGAGGPGLWLASDTGAGLVGIDLSRMGLVRAGERARRVAVRPASFVRSPFSPLPLRTGAADGAVSFDALQYAPDKGAALREAARVLRQGARLVASVFEVECERVADLPVLGDGPVADYRPILEAEGFTVDHYEETPGWRQRVTSAYQAVIDGADRLSEELGPPAYFALDSEMSLTLERDFYRRRVLFAALRSWP